MIRLRMVLGLWAYATFSTVTYSVESEQCDRWVEVNKHRPPVLTSRHSEHFRQANQRILRDLPQHRKVGSHHHLASDRLVECVSRVYQAKPHHLQDACSRCTEQGAKEPENNPLRFTDDYATTGQPRVNDILNKENEHLQTVRGMATKSTPPPSPKTNTRVHAYHNTSRVRAP